MLQTGKKTSSRRRSDRSPGQSPRPNRTTTSTSSRAKSVRCAGDRDAHVQIGMALPQPAQSRNEPVRSEARQRADGQGARALGPQRPRGRLVQPVQKFGQRRRVAFADARQRHAFAREPNEQRTTEPGFERLHLLADGARRDGEFVGGLLEAEMPGGGLEGAQGGERRKTAAGHCWQSFSWANPETFSFASILGQ